MELCRGDGGGGALRGLICGAMPDHGLAGVSMRGGSDGYDIAIGKSFVYNVSLGPWRGVGAGHRVDGVSKKKKARSV